MKGARLVVLGLSLGLLSGCGVSNDFDDLRRYMDEVRAKPKGTIEPLPAFVPYEAFTYSAASLRQPHRPPKKIDLAQLQKVSKDLQPDETPDKQLLVGFNIDNLIIVDTLTNDAGKFPVIIGGEGDHR